MQSSMLEIYNEEYRDLLTKARSKDDKKHQVRVFRVLYKVVSVVFYLQLIDLGVIWLNLNSNVCLISHTYTHKTYAPFLACTHETGGPQLRRQHYSVRPHNHRCVHTREGAKSVLCADTACRIDLLDTYQQS